MLVLGRVLDPQGRPVANAVIMVYAAFQPPRRRTYAAYRPEPIGTARSDLSGHFQADAPRTTSARHHLVGAVALAPGYGAGWVDLEADSERSQVDITLRSEHVIQGRLFAVNGRPAQSVAVRVATMGRFIPANLVAHRRETIDGPSLLSQSGNRLPAWPAPRSAMPMAGSPSAALARTCESSSRSTTQDLPGKNTPSIPLVHPSQSQ